MEPNSQTSEQTQAAPETTAQPAAAQPANPATPAAAAPAQPNTPPSHPEHSKKRTAIIAGILIVVLFIIGSLFYILGAINKTKELNSYKAPQPTTQSSQQAQVSPAAQDSLSEEEKILETIDTGDPSKDLTGLEKDLSNL